MIEGLTLCKHVSARFDQKTPNTVQSPNTVTGRFKSEPQITIKMTNQKFPGPRDGMGGAPVPESAQFRQAAEDHIAITFPGTGPEDAQRRRWRPQRWQGAAMHQHLREK